MTCEIRIKYAQAHVWQVRYNIISLTVDKLVGYKTFINYNKFVAKRKKAHPNNSNYVQRCQSVNDARSI